MHNFSTACGRGQTWRKTFSGGENRFLVHGWTVISGPLNIRYPLLLPLIVLVACSRPAPPLGTLRREAEATVALYQARDYGQLVDRMYPTVLEEAGGRQELIESFRQERLEVAERGGEILEYSVGEPGDAAISGGKIFAIVPTVTKLDTPVSSITTHGYLLAISTDHGATWKFLVGSTLIPGRTYLLVPDLPSGLKFPPDEAPVVVKKPTPEPHPPTGSPSRSALQIEAIAVANASTAGAYHEFVAGLYPPMVAALGGPDKTAAFFRNAYWKLHNAGRMTASSVEVDDPGEFATQGDRTFAVVPVTYRGENAKQKYVRHAVFLAISDDGGASWKFIPGITPKMAADLQILSLPPDLKIPEPPLPVVTDK